MRTRSRSARSPPTADPVSKRCDERSISATRPSGWSAAIEGETRSSWSASSSRSRSSPSASSISSFSVGRSAFASADDMPGRTPCSCAAEDAHWTRRAFFSSATRTTGSSARQPHRSIRNWGRWTTQYLNMRSGYHGDRRGALLAGLLRPALVLQPRQQPALHVLLLAARHTDRAELLDRDLACLVEICRVLEVERRPLEV